MKSHKEITHWELSRRIEAINDFRDKTVAYFNATHKSRPSGRRHDSDASRAMKPAINMALDEVRSMLNAAEIGTTSYYRSAPVAGGHEYNIDVLTNIFRLTNFQIPYDSATGLMERAVGVYSSELSAAKWRTFNPFWWLGKILSWFAHLPYKALRGAGFDTTKAEQSVIGKLLTLVVGSIAVIAAFLSILTSLGLLDTFKKLLGIP